MNLNLFKMNHVVIMAGGIGSRFWPLSTPEFPKQFIDVLGCGRTLIQMTVDRFQGLCPEENFWVVTNEKYVGLVKQQIPAIPDSHILAEPAARNTAPCIAWAAWSIGQEDPLANIVFTPSDAVVMDPQEFRRVIGNALAFTAPDANGNSIGETGSRGNGGSEADGGNFTNGRIVTIGIKPNRPETGYGYIQAGPKVKDKARVAGENSREKGKFQVERENTCEIHNVRAFKEKPDLETAKTYLAQGSYLWNAGIFVLNINTITNAIEKYKPQLAAAMDAMVSAPLDGETLEDRTKRIFPTCEKVSIDFAVMEPAAAEGLVYTHPADFGWSDLGNWQSLHEKLGKDENNNATVGNVRLYECSNCVVHTEDAKAVILQGLDGYIVSEKDGRILICRREEEQRIKEFSNNG